MYALYAGIAAFVIAAIVLAVSIKRSISLKKSKALLDMNHDSEPGVSSSSVIKESEPGEEASDIQEVLDISRKYPEQNILGNLVHDSSSSRKMIRVTKTKRLIRVIHENLQPITENILCSLFQYDITGFRFYRWVLNSSNNGGEVLVDENRLEGFSFLEMIKGKIPFSSIDLVTYGSDSLEKNADNIKMDSTWWKFSAMVIFDPCAMNYPDVFSSLMENNFECIVSADCLLSVLDDISGTVYNTESLKNAIRNRAESLHSKQTKEETVLINLEMKKRNQTIELRIAPPPASVEQKNKLIDQILSVTPQEENYETGEEAHA